MLFESKTFTCLRKKLLLISREIAFFRKRNNKSTSRKIATLPFSFCKFGLKFWQKLVKMFWPNLSVNQPSNINFRISGKTYKLTSWCKFRLCDIRHKIFLALGWTNPLRWKWTTNGRPNDPTNSETKKRSCYQGLKCVKWPAT